MLMVFELLLFLAKYSSSENSHVVASKERWPGDLLPQTKPRALIGQMSQSVSRPSVDV